MTTKSLDEIFDDVALKMCESIELSAYDGDTSFGFCYEEHGYSIEGSGRVGGDWYEEGDGYWEPRENYLENGWGYLNELSITHIDEETDEETEFTEDTVKDITKRLDKELSEFMKHY